MQRFNRSRKARYIVHWFLESEADVLKTVPIGSPYAQQMIRDRNRLRNEVIKQGNYTRRKLEQAITMQYIARGWKSKGQRIDKSSVFAMVRDYQALWRNTAPPDDVEKWVSPSAKKSHHGSNINLDKLHSQKRAYNNRPEVREKRRQYRLKNRDKIAEQRRRLRDFKRAQGQN
jgi:hypothetical protein